MQREHKIFKVAVLIFLSGWIFLPLTGCGGGNGNIPAASILSSGRITLSWNEIPGAASYNIYISTSPGVTRLNSYKIPAASTPVTLTDLEPDTTYYFMVIVFNDSGESRTSREISHTVTDAEGFVDFGDLLEKPGPDDKPMESEAMAAAPSPAANKVVTKPEPQTEITQKDQSGAGIIICFGDSLTYGTGARSGGDYPSQLATMIDKPVINKGLPGDTTASALRRLNRDVLSAKPDMVLITLGGNDLKNSVSKITAFRNLKYIVEAIQKQGAKVIIGGLKFPGMDRGFGKGYQELAQQTGAILIPDIFDGILDNPDLMSDPIHPNESGYRIIARRFSKALVPAKKTSQAVSKKTDQAAIKETGQAAQSRDPETRDVTLAWGDVTNATSYNIYWSDKPGVTQQNGAKIANVTNPYKMKDLEKGKKYYIIVTAVNQSGESKSSKEFSFTVGQ